MHITSDGSISPKKCPGCPMEFEGIDKGEQRNTFVIVAKEKKSTIIVNEEAEEKTVSSAPASVAKKEKEETASTKKGAFKIKIVKNKDS